jgi:tetratricopeptide (TPR) repeat protein
VALGRIYHQMGNIEDSRIELEKVLMAVPDNLLANKLLGDIYESSSRPKEALERYRMVQNLTPNDPEVDAGIRRLELALTSAVTKAPRHEETGAKPAESFGDYEPSAQQSQTLLTPSVEEDIPEAVASEWAVEDSPDQEPVEVVPSPSVTGPDLSELAASFLKMEPSEAEPEPEEIEEPVEAVEWEEALADNDDEPVPEAPPAEFVELEQFPWEKEAAASEKADELTTETLAELYVSQGLADKAVKVYQKLLLNDPGNLRIEHRLRELNPAADLAVAPEAAVPVESVDTNALADEWRHEVPVRESHTVSLSEERSRKIATLEGWLATIRRERFS